MCQRLRGSPTCTRAGGARSAAASQRSCLRIRSEHGKTEDDPRTPVAIRITDGGEPSSRAAYIKRHDLPRAGSSRQRQRHRRAAAPRAVFARRRSTPCAVLLHTAARAARRAAEPSALRDHLCRLGSRFSRPVIANPPHPHTHTPGVSRAATRWIGQGGRRRIAGLAKWTELRSI